LLAVTVPAAAAIAAAAAATAAAAAADDDEDDTDQDCGDRMEVWRAACVVISSNFASQSTVFTIDCIVVVSVAISMRNHERLVRLTTLQCLNRHVIGCRSFNELHVLLGTS